MKKKLIIPLVATVGLLAGGGWYAKHLLQEKIYNQVTAFANDPEIQKEIAELDVEELQKSITDSLPATKQSSDSSAAPIPSSGSSSDKPSAGNTDSTQTKGTSQSAEQTGTTSDSTYKSNDTNETGADLSFKNRDAAAAYALKKFSAKEILDYSVKYKNWSSLPVEEKEKIKADVLSRFSLEEIQALQEAASS